jgi:hypothetical protein
MSTVRFNVATWILAGCMVMPCPALGANRSADKRVAEAHADEALVYLIREKRFVGGGRTMFVFSDQTFLGALDNDSYTFAYLPPGKHLLWLNWAKINTEIDVEAGKTYYFAIWTTFDALDENSGKAFLGGISAYATPEPRELDKAAEHIRERYGKAVASSAGKPDDDTKATSLKRRAAHVASWPKVDLAAYPSLCVEPFAMADPKAEETKKQYLVDSAPQRIAELVLEELGSTTFTAVQKQINCGEAADTVVLRARITQYKPGSDTARFMLAGAGSAQIEMMVNLVSAQSGQTLVEFQPKGTWAWGGAVGAAKGISDLEKNVAYEVAGYLKSARGQALSE